MKLAMRAMIWVTLAVTSVGPSGAAGDHSEAVDMFVGKKKERESSECQEAKAYLSNRGISTAEMSCSEAIERASELAAQEYAAEAVERAEREAAERRQAAESERQRIDLEQRRIAAIEQALEQNRQRQLVEDLQRAAEASRRARDEKKRARKEALEKVANMGREATRNSLNWESLTSSVSMSKPLYSYVPKPSEVLRTQTDEQAVAISRIAGFAAERINPATVRQTDDGWTSAQVTDEEGNVTSIYTRPGWFGDTHFHTSSKSGPNAEWHSPIDDSIRGGGSSDHRGRERELKFAAGGSVTARSARDTWGAVLPSGGGIVHGQESSLGRVVAEVTAGSDGFKGEGGFFPLEGQVSLGVFGPPGRTSDGKVVQHQTSVGVGAAIGYGAEVRLQRGRFKIKKAQGLGASLDLEHGRQTVE